MHLSGVVASVALLPAALTVAAYRRQVPWPVTFVLGHIAATGFAVAVAASEHLANHTTGLLGKVAQGRFQWWGLLLCWPYHVGLRTKLWYNRRTSTEPPWTKVAPGWYLGAWPQAPHALPPGGPAVLDVTCELPRRHAQPYLCLATWDTHAPPPRLIQRGVAWAAEQRRSGRPVLVHCAHGHGRSTTVLCAAFVEAGLAPDWQSAFAAIKLLRPRVKLNRRQQAALRAWEAQRSGSNGTCH